MTAGPRASASGERLMIARGIEAGWPRRLAARFICGRPPTCKDWLGQHARIACAHMSGLRLGLRPLAKMGFANSEIQTRERHLLPVNRAETLPVRLAPITPPLPILQVPALASDLRC